MSIFHQLLVIISLFPSPYNQSRKTSIRISLLIVLYYRLFCFSSPHLPRQSTNRIYLPRTIIHSLSLFAGTRTETTVERRTNETTQTKSEAKAKHTHTQNSSQRGLPWPSFAHAPPLIVSIVNCSSCRPAIHSICFRFLYAFFADLFALLDSIDGKLLFPRGIFRLISWWAAVARDFYAWCWSFRLDDWSFRRWSVLSTNAMFINSVCVIL